MKPGFSGNILPWCVGAFAMEVKGAWARTPLNLTHSAISITSDNNVLRYNNNLYQFSWLLCIGFTIETKRT